jgi:hypothetical protein
MVVAARRGLGGREPSKALGTSQQRGELILEETVAPLVLLARTAATNSAVVATSSLGKPSLEARRADS